MMPKSFQRSLRMLIIGLLLIVLTIFIDMPEAFFWFFLILSLLLNTLGIVGIIVYYWLEKNQN